MARSPEAERQWRLAGRFSAVGVEMAAAVAIGALGGRWLDGKLGTEPYLMWLGLGVGIGAAVRAVVRVVQAYRRM